MIITGGVNVYPQEAENVLAMHPKVNDVAVFGVPNDDFGEEVKAVVEPVSMDEAGPDLERGADRLLQGAPGRREVPPLGRLPHRAPPPPHRQALQAPAQGRVLGRRRPGHLRRTVPANAAYPFLDWPGPLAFAHRGGASEAPENTMPAFEHAVRLGYRYLETDVHVTADGVLIAFHDDRLDRVTDRTGVIAELPWREVQQAKVDGREPIPLLEDLLAAWPDVRVNIDPKQDAVVEPLAAAILRTGTIDRVCVGAFSDQRIAKVQALVGPGAVHVDGSARGGAASCRRHAAVPGGGGVRSPCAQVPPTQGRVPLVTARLRRHRPPPRRPGARVDDRRPQPRWPACSTSASTGS